MSTEKDKFIAVLREKMTAALQRPLMSPFTQEEKEKAQAVFYKETLRIIHEFDPDLGIVVTPLPIMDGNDVICLRFETLIKPAGDP